ncbi:MAG: FimB/Mfa2 family fimbrial subunit [Odoribacter sp.]|nr:FimB/Mfa2 family fimbrial subunit [Odoribacter sp.]
MLVSLSSCEKIYDNLEACPHGVSLRFVYDYNMEYANAFPKQVDCLTLYVYDKEDRYVATHVVTADSLLSDENWRMQLELPEGRYRFVAYGGLACAKSSFSLLEEPSDTSRWESLRVSMDAYRQSDTVHENLHNLYWGDVEVETADLYKEGTVKMMKNTNNIRIVLQDVNTQQPVYGEDFAFSITDDNTLFGADNDLLENGKVIYTPWAQGDAIVGFNTIGTEVIGAYAELSVSRLMVKNSPVLRVKSRDTGEDVIDIPLLNYLRLYKSMLYETADMGEQEFLDRQSNWTMLFLLDSQKRWVKTYIKINDWKVVINETSL